MVAYTILTLTISRATRKFVISLYSTPFYYFLSPLFIFNFLPPFFFHSLSILLSTSNFLSFLFYFIFFFLFIQFLPHVSLNVTPLLPHLFFSPNYFSLLILLFLLFSFSEKGTFLSHAVLPGTVKMVAYTILALTISRATRKFVISLCSTPLYHFLSPLFIFDFLLPFFIHSLSILLSTSIFLSFPFYFLLVLLFIFLFNQFPPPVPLNVTSLLPHPSFSPNSFPLPILLFLLFSFHPSFVHFFSLLSIPFPSLIFLPISF